MSSQIRKKTILDMMDHDFLSGDLPDDFLVKEISDMYKNDDVVHVLKERPVYSGKERDIEFSRFGKMNYEDGSFHTGTKELDPPIWYPKPDFSSVDVIYDYWTKANVNPKYRMPDVPIAQPEIPQNKLDKFSPFEFVLESTFATLGFVLYNPSVGARMSLSAYFPVVVKDSFVTVQTKEYMMDEYPDKEAVYFQPYEDYNGPHDRVVSMQFNPFHPMSVKLLRSIKWENDHKVSGSYSNGNREYKYQFDIWDSRYRIHSEQWLQVFGKEYKQDVYSGYLECFDLVSTYDFAHLLHIQYRPMVIEPLCIEPLLLGPATDVVPTNDLYSVVGPFYYVKRGQGPEVYSPYSNQRFFTEMNEAISISEITDEVQVINNSSYVYRGVMKFMREGSLCNDVNFYCKTKNKGPERTYRFFKRDPLGPLKFFHINCEVRSFPRNISGSIIYHPKFCTLDQIKALIETNKDIHNYLPSFSPLPIDYMDLGPDMQMEMIDPMDDVKQNEIYVNNEKCDAQLIASLRRYDAAKADDKIQWIVPDHF